MIYLPAEGVALAEPPRLAFAVPRKVGGAVERNRLRRAVRGRLVERARDPLRAFPPGAYLVTVRPDAAGLPPAQVADLVEGCLDRLGGDR